MTKQDKIQESYGDYWDKVKKYVNNDGWLDKQVFSSFDGLTYEDVSSLGVFTHKNNFCRPESLSGIENNNGWNKIKYIQDLPKSKDKTFVFIDKLSDEFVWHGEDVLDNEFYFMRYTHWKIKEKHLPPLY